MTLYDLRRGCKIEKIGHPLTMALGCFDGFHKGHIELIEAAKSSEFPSAVFTFSRNPFGTLHIVDPDDKLKLIADMGVDYCAVYDFEEIRDMPCEEFVNGILIGSLDVKRAICGFNFRFGANASGNTEFLTREMEKRGRECVIVDAYRHNGETVSSSRIRALLGKGRMEETSELLGRNYSLVYNVSHGNGIGNILGFPTINAEYSDIMQPLALGVYICRCMGRPAVTNFGVRPTITSDQTPVYETYILDYDEDLYEKSVCVEFLKMLRPEMKFSSSVELIAQIEQDVLETRSFFEE